jgi:hypothetical protein
MGRTAYLSPAYRFSMVRLGFPEAVSLPPQTTTVGMGHCSFLVPVGPPRINRTIGTLILFRMDNDPVRPSTLQPTQFMPITRTTAVAKVIKMTIIPTIPIATACRQAVYLTHAVIGLQFRSKSLTGKPVQ